MEFGNRVVAVGGILASLAVWHASRRVDGLPRWVRLTALAAFLGTLAQIPLGGLTVILDDAPRRPDGSRRSRRRASAAP